MKTLRCAVGLLALLMVSAPTLGAQETAAPAGGAQAATAAPEKVEVPVRGPKLGSSEVYTIGNGVESPLLMRDVKPNYTAAAQAARIEGIVHMDGVVLPDGTVGDVKVTKSLDPGLDQESVLVLRKWRFKPATLNGKAVPVQIKVEMTFTLKPSQ